MRFANQEASDITPLVRRFTWTQSMIGGGFSWAIKFASSQWNEWDSLMMGKDRPEFQFRLRSDENDGQNQSTEWQTAITDASKASFSQDTSMVGAIFGADRRLLLAQEMRSRQFAVGRATDVFSRIAQEHGLNADITASGAVDRWTQAFEDDWSFMRRIARETTVQSGRGDSYLWMDNGTLRFGTVELSDKSDRRYDMSVVENRVDGYVATYSGRRADRMGAATCRGIGFDFRLKRAVTFTMDPGTAATHPSLASHVPRRMSDGLRVFPVFEEARDRVEETVRARWGRYAPRYLAVRLKTRPDLTVRPGKIMSIEANLDQRRETPFMGRYAILEVQHVLERGAIATTLVGYRREAHKGEAQPTGASADNIGTRDQSGLSAGINPRTIVVAQEL